MNNAVFGKTMENMGKYSEMIIDRFTRTYYMDMGSFYNLHENRKHLRRYYHRKR